MNRSAQILLVSVVIYSMGGMLIANSNKYFKDATHDPFRETAAARIGDYPYPTNPMNDRAIGYLLQGKVNNGLTNYGNSLTGMNTHQGSGENTPIFRQ